MEKEEVKVGQARTIQKVVQESDTSAYFGSGQLEKLFATPSLVALMIKASVELIDPTLPEGFISVGKSSHVVHSQPTILGETVSVTVTVTEKEGDRIMLEMTAFDETGVIGTGTHERYVVNKQALFRKVKERIGQLESKDF
jgi:predicted thioesterase